LIAFRTLDDLKVTIRNEVTKTIVADSAFLPKNEDKMTLYDVYCDYSEAVTTGSVATKSYKSLKELPYNTGKVAIGSAYVPQKRTTLTREEELLQVALLGVGRTRQQALTFYSEIAIYALGFIALAVIWLVE